VEAIELTLVGEGGGGVSPRVAARLGPHTSCEVVPSTESSAQVLTQSPWT
jgi:hypothetical protein